MGDWAKADVLFVGAVIAIFVLGVAMPSIRRHRRQVAIANAPTASQRRWRRPPD